MFFPKIRLEPYGTYLAVLDLLSQTSGTGAYNVKFEKRSIKNCCTKIIFCDAERIKSNVAITRLMYSVVVLRIVKGHYYHVSYMNKPLSILEKFL